MAPEVMRDPLQGFKVNTENSSKQHLNLLKNWEAIPWICGNIIEDSYYIEFYI